MGSDFHNLGGGGALSSNINIYSFCVAFKLQSHTYLQIPGLIIVYITQNINTALKVQSRCRTIVERVHFAIR
jgi:hypothetical protein